MNILTEQEHERRLRVYHKAVAGDVGFKEFVKMVGLNYAAAYRWCRINNLVVGKAGNRSIMRVSDEQFIQIYSENEDPKDIISNLGIDNSAYYHRCQKLGLRPKKYPNRKYTPWDRNKKPPVNEYTEELRFFERELVKHSANGAVSVSSLMKEINKMNSRGGMVNG